MKNQYTPDCVSPPGETLKDWVRENVLSIHANGVCDYDVAMWLFQSVGVPIRISVGVANSTLPITPDLAQKLEQATSIPATFWLERERLYREAQCKSE